MLRGKGKHVSDDDYDNSKRTKQTQMENLNTKRRWKEKIFNLKMQKFK